MPLATPTLMDPREAAHILEKSIKKPEAPLTVADAAAQSGLPLRDAERGLHWLTSHYRGHLRVTNEGDLLYLFPTAFTRPWVRTDAFGNALKAVGRGALGLTRFVVRAWLTIVLFAYVGIFLALMIGLSLARSNSDSDRGGFGGGTALYFVMRILGDALFWTFHPFSPIAIGRGNSWGYEREEVRSRDSTPFYEKVNRFFFGVTDAPEDPRVMERKILAQIRAQKGRIGLADVMRVTGLPRHEADPLMARLMLDYDGDVSVSDEGGITYSFRELRKTATAGREQAPRPAWSDKKAMPPLTGNTLGSNVLIAGLNGFNLLMSLYSLAAGLTISRLIMMFQRVPIEKIPLDGTPMVLGMIPLVFSLALFALPIGRMIARPIKAKRIERENARLAVLEEVLVRVDAKAPVTDAALVERWKRVTGETPDSKDLTRVVVELGGDAEVSDEGQVRYRFADLENEASALEVERRQASEREASTGKVDFASDR